MFSAGNVNGKLYCIGRTTAASSDVKIQERFESGYLAGTQHGTDHENPRGTDRGDFVEPCR